MVGKERRITKMKMLKLILLILSISFICSCATTQYSTLNLLYEPASTTPSEVDVKIAVVKAKYTAVQEVSQQLVQSPFASLMERAMPPDYQIKSQYNNEYVLRLQNSILTDLKKIISGKGLRVYRSYDSVDEISYSDKKNMDLILEPEFDLGPVVRNARTTRPFLGTSDKGTIQLTGKIKLVFFEPLSKENILIKTIDISSTGLDSSVSYESGQDAENQLIVLLNNMYPQLMEKIEKVIDTEEIKALLSDIKHLKDKHK